MSSLRSSKAWTEPSWEHDAMSRFPVAGSAVRSRPVIHPAWALVTWTLETQRVPPCRATRWFESADMEPLLSS